MKQLLIVNALNKLGKNYVDFFKTNCVSSQCWLDLPFIKLCILNHVWTMSMEAMPLCLPFDWTKFMATKMIRGRVLWFKVQTCKISSLHINWSNEIHIYNINYIIHHYCNNIKCFNPILNYKCVMCKNKSGRMCTQIVTRIKV